VDAEIQLEYQMSEFIAHENQLLRSHLDGVSILCRKNANKIGFGDYGETLGLLHDMGKYSRVFQNYIKSAVGILAPDIDGDYVDSNGLKGKIDHSTAGAQLFWEKLNMGNDAEKILAQIVSLCLVSHHSGLIDCLKTDANGTTDQFSRRINKADSKTHLHEALEQFELKRRFEELIATQTFILPLSKTLRSIINSSPQKAMQSTVVQFKVGLLVRFLFSCLIDADRQDTADSEKPKVAQFRQRGSFLSWAELISRLNRELGSYSNPLTLIDKIRQDISSHCLVAADRPMGVFTLSVPTGGGKTLSSLRFALHHAEKHKLERIIFVIPFTSIIDQNADRVRRILEPKDAPADKGKIVLEHHSNIGAEKQSWREKLLIENWDAPVIFTTMVQFLEAMFGSGTRGARRMHQLAKSVIVFDEVQTLPIRCVHMFCNAINFLVDQGGSSVVLCTATQPLLGEIDSTKGALHLAQSNEIIPDVSKLFEDLKRVSVLDSQKTTGWGDAEIADLAIKEAEKVNSCLVVVNMKKSARALFQVIKEMAKHHEAAIGCYHLSTSMCPRHRKRVLRRVKRRLSVGYPTICVSTQLIEAGVDIDFGSVIRYLAGLDSIAQAAGRCNRNGKRDKGLVYIVNPKEENIDCLKDIAVGQQKTQRVLNDFKVSPEKYQDDIIGPQLLEWYYRNFFYERRAEMTYPVSENVAGRNDTLLNMLSTNSLTVSDYQRSNMKSPDICLRQSFMAAAEAFRSIDAPTHSVIVGFEKDGKELVNQLCAAFDVEKQYELVKKAQQYSVSLFPHEFDKLHGVVKPVQERTSIYFLTDNRYYDQDFGIVTEPVKSPNEELMYA
jgi:CRISPR-associated endonuclease/helicase Cas3